MGQWHVREWLLAITSNAKAGCLLFFQASSAGTVITKMPHATNLSGACAPEHALTDERLVVSPCAFISF